MPTMETEPNDDPIDAAIREAERELEHAAAVAKAKIQVAEALRNVAPERRLAVLRAAAALLDVELS